MINEAKRVVEQLNKNNFIAYFAGGSVRDLLLKKEPKDIDIATNAKPDDVEKIFENTYPIGKEFGTIAVRSGNYNFEVTTFRAEEAYDDSRRPSRITFVNEKEDALRRDFTINGIFYNPITQKFIDYVGGIDDIKKKTIRFIGDPSERINEDHLRLLRAIRFKITLNFQYDQKTFDALREYSQLIDSVSSERIRDELNLIFSNRYRHLGLIELSESGLLKMIIPEVENLKGIPQPHQYHHEGDAFVHTYLALKSLDENASLRLAWAVLLHDIGKAKTLSKKGEKITFYDHASISSEMTINILKRLKFSNIEIEDISYVIKHHMSLLTIEKMRPFKKFAFLLDPKFRDLVSLAIADAKGTIPVDLSIIDSLELNYQKALEWKKEKEELKHDRMLTGDDLVKLGFLPNAQFKEILEDVHDMVLTDIIKTKEDAINYVKSKYENYRR